jgi:hypothetical protein
MTAQNCSAITATNPSTRGRINAFSANSTKNENLLNMISKPTRYVPSDYGPDIPEFYRSYCNDFWRIRRLGLQKKEGKN